VVLFEDETGFSLHPKLGRYGQREGVDLLSIPGSASEAAEYLWWVDLIQGSHGIMKWISGNTDGLSDVAEDRLSL